MNFLCASLALVGDVVTNKKRAWIENIFKSVICRNDETWQQQRSGVVISPLKAAQITQSKVNPMNLVKKLF